MKERVIALLLAAAAVGVPSWLGLKLAGPRPAAEEPVLTALAAKTDAVEETVLTAAVPLAAAMEQLRSDIADMAEKTMHLTPPAEIDLSWWQSHYKDMIGYVYSPGTPLS